MGKRDRIACSSCDAKIDVGSFCPRCGKPTPVASHDERVAWEVAQWVRVKGSRTTRPAAVAVADPPRGDEVADAPPVPSSNGHIARANGLVAPTAETGSENGHARNHTASSHRAEPRREGRRISRVGRPAVTAVSAPTIEAARPAPAGEPPPSIELEPVEPKRAVVPPAANILPPQPVAPPRESRRALRAQRKAVASLERRAAKETAKVEARARKTEKRAGAEPKKGEDGRKRPPALELLPGETAERMVPGRTGLRRATLVVTTFRVAIVRKRGRIRWIPLEEVADISTAWRGAPTLMLEGSAEVFGFQHPSRTQLNELTGWLVARVRAARDPGSAYRSHALLEMWWERIETLKSSGLALLQLSLRRKDGVAAALWLSPLGVLALVALKLI